jgi:hypothetical protein
LVKTETTLAYNKEAADVSRVKAVGSLGSPRSLKRGLGNNKKAIYQLPKRHQWTVMPFLSVIKELGVNEFALT